MEMEKGEGKRGNPYTYKTVPWKIIKMIFKILNIS